MKERITGGVGLGLLVALLTLLLVGVTKSGDLKGSIRVEKNRKAELHKMATVSLTEAVEIALSEFPGYAVEAELDDEGGYLVYEVEIVTRKGEKAEVMIDAGNGQVLADADEDGEGEEKDENDEDGEYEEGSVSFHASIRVDQDRKNLHRLVKISISDAQEAALSVRPGTIIESELERENGYLVYSIEIADAEDRTVEVLIDAGNGKVLTVENED